MAAKTTASRMTTAKKRTVKKVAAKKPAKKSTAKKTVAKKRTVKMEVAKKRVVKISTAKKTTIKKRVVKKTAAKRKLRDHLNVEIDCAGYDYSDNVVARLAVDRPRLNVWKADAATWTPKLKNMTLSCCLVGYTTAGQIVRKLASVLNKGGIFINYEPTYGNPMTRWARIRIFDKNTLFDEQTERGFSVVGLLDNFKHANFVPERILFPSLLSYVLYYNPDAFPLLNFGGKIAIKSAFRFDELFMENRVGRALSFATLSVWKKI